MNHAGNDFIQIQNARLQHLHAAEGEQLAREGGGALGGLLNLFDVLQRGILAIGGATRQAVEKHFSVALHHHQQIIEIVGDAAGEFADGLQFLRLAQLVDELFAVGDIERDADHADDFAISGAQRPHVGFEDALLPVQFVGECFARQRAPVRRDGWMLRVRGLKVFGESLAG